jgi:hypothetical protein
MPKVAPHPIIKTARGREEAQPLHTILSIIREKSTSRLLMDPMEIIALEEILETRAMSPDPTLSPEAPFPYLALVPSA